MWNTLALVLLFYIDQSSRFRGGTEDAAGWTAAGYIPQSRSHEAVDTMSFDFSIANCDKNKRQRKNKKIMTTTTTLPHFEVYTLTYGLLGFFFHL